MKPFFWHGFIALVLLHNNTVNADHNLYRAVFSLPQVKNELRVTEKEAEQLRSLNREYIDAVQKMALNSELSWQDKSQATRNARQVAENQLLETLSPNRRKRLDQLVFQYILSIGSVGAVDTALRDEAVSLSKKEAEQFLDRRREINLAAADLQSQTEFELWMRYLGEVFPEKELAKLVGSRFDGELVEYRSIIPIHPDWHLYQTNIELIRFLISPSVQTELKMKIEQLTEINQFNHTKIAEILERETKQIRQIASTLQELESKDSSENEIDQILNAKRAQIAVVDREIREFVKRVLEDDQLIRLDQLVFQSGLRMLNTRIAFYFAGADKSRLDQFNERLSQITKYGQQYGNVKDLANAKAMDFHQTQYMDALEEIIGKRRLFAVTGKQLRFHEVDLGLNVRKSKDARQSDNPRRN